MSEIVKIDPKEFGLEESKAADIAAQFKPMLDKMIELEKEFNEVIKIPVESASKQARELRLKYVKVRTGTADIHKAQKAFYLAGGRFVDGWKNAQLFASEGIEKKLQEIEDYAVNLERKRISNLQAERESILLNYEVENVASLNLGAMDESVWENFLTGTKINYAAKKESERIAKEAEEKRIEDERIERERIKKENEELRKQAKEQAEELSKKQNEIEEIRKEQERIEAEKIASVEAELSKGDAEIFADLINDLSKVKNGYKFQSKKYNDVFLEVCSLLEKTIIHAKSKIK